MSQATMTTATPPMTAICLRAALTSVQVMSDLTSVEQTTMGQ